MNFGVFKRSSCNDPYMVAELETIIKQEQVDCLVGDYIGFGASYAAERLGIPFVTVSSWAVTLNADALPVFLLTATTCHCPCCD